jgi:Tol biopolymer transport system component
VTRVLATALATVLLIAAPAGAAGSGPAAPRPGPVAAPAPAAPLPAPPGTTGLLSKARNGGFPDSGSIEPSISASGRYVAFTSIASDLVANDEQGSVEVFVLDRRSGKISRAPLPPGYGRSTAASQSEPAISADGTVVAYAYQPPPPPDRTADGPMPVFIVAWDRGSGTAEIVSRNAKNGPQGGARQPSVSADGRYIAYTTVADLPGERDGGADDVFRYDRRTDATIVVSRSFGGGGLSGDANSPSISGDGDVVAFISDGGDSVVPEDTGLGMQVYTRTISSGTNERISRPPDGKATNNRSIDPAISSDGRYVAFASSATNLTPEGTVGLFRYDRRTGTMILVSVTPSGAGAKGTSGQPSITPNGAMVAWTSTATDLVPETAGRIAPAATTRGQSEVYLRDIDAGETILISVSLTNTGSAGQSFQPAVAGGGRYVAFASNSRTLVRDDGNNAYDVFLRDLPPVPVINPATLDLGSRAVGTESLPLAATLGNAGWSPLSVTKASITGANKADFRVVADGCKARTLRRNEACTVSVVFKPVAKGARAATLAVADAFAGSPRTVRLRGRASQAKLVLDPPIGPPGIVTIAEGSGFPPSTQVRLHWTIGITPKLATVTTDAQGRLRVPVLVFHNDLTGKRELSAEAVDGAAFPSVAATMLVTKPPVIPPRFDIIRIVDLPLVLVIRG